MNRRVFSKWLAFGAGLFSTAAASTAEESSDKIIRTSRDAAEPGDKAAPVQETAWDNPPVTVNDFIARAKAKLPQATFDYITSGSEDEVTLRDNVDAFRRIRLIPPLLHGVSEADLSTNVFGQKIAIPVIIAPVAALRMYHPEGALASARAAARAGTIFTASTSAYHSVEEIAAACDGPKWFQLYAPQDREITRKLVLRAEKAGYKAIAVTVDLGERKDADLRNGFFPPRELLLKSLRDIGHTELPDDISLDELRAYNNRAFAPSLSWEFFAWLRDITRLPILVKGVLSPEATRQAIQLGLDGVIVSNHGGRRLDGMPASIDVLKEVAAAANGKLEVLMDGGIRRGGDVLKALALGAKAVLIGRPHAWALAAGGEAGVKQVLDIFRDELTNAMVASGCASVDKITANLIRT